MTLFIRRSLKLREEIRNHSPDGSSVLVDGVVGGVTGISGAKRRQEVGQRRSQCILLSQGV